MTEGGEGSSGSPGSLGGARAGEGRFHGFDVIRLASFFAIATFHVSLVHYYTPAIEIAAQSRVIGAVHAVARLLSFSGFTVCFLTSLLTAYSGRAPRKRFRLFAFLFVGWLVFSFMMFGDRDRWFYWDIYPLIFLGVLTATLADLAGRVATRVVSVVGFLLLCVPWWSLGAAWGVGDGWSGNALFGVGNCDRQTSEWPVLPWIGLVWLGYGLGRELRELRREGRLASVAVSRKEAACWAVALAASVPWLGAFYAIDLGRFFACEAYQQPPPVWWAHFAWPLALMRLSVDPRVAGRLARLAPLRWVSSLAISRRFWLAYILNYLLCYLLSWLVTTSGVETTRWNVLTIEVIAVGFVPLTEVVTRGVLALARLIADLLGFGRGGGGGGAARGVAPIP
jgi:hypothetical protein